MIIIQPWKFLSTVPLFCLVPFHFPFPGKGSCLPASSEFPRHFFRGCINYKTVKTLYHTQNQLEQASGPDIILHPSLSNFFFLMIVQLFTTYIFQFMNVFHEFENFTISSTNWELSKFVILFGTEGVLMITNSTAKQCRAIFHTHFPSRAAAFEIYHV